MSSPLLKLECFEADPVLPDDTQLSPQDVESLRARAFEDGYGAGWTDALEQMRNEDALRRAASEEALQATAFGYHEARDGLERCFVDLAAQVIAVILPKLRPIGLQQHLEQELRALAVNHFSDRLEILCAPGSAQAIVELVRANPGLDVTVTEEPSFMDAQLLIRVGQTDRVIDLDRVTELLQTAFGDAWKQKDIAHG